MTPEQEIIVQGIIESFDTAIINHQGMGAALVNFAIDATPIPQALIDARDGYVAQCAIEIDAYLNGGLRGAGPSNITKK